MSNTQEQPAQMDQVERRVMRNPPNVAFATTLMNAAARSGNEGVIWLAAQLAGAEPCKTCGFVWNHCKCVHNEELTLRNGAQRNGECGDLAIYE
jgi:hypothetical protein